MAAPGGICSGDTVEVVESFLAFAEEGISRAGMLEEECGDLDGRTRGWAWAWRAADHEPASGPRTLEIFWWRVRVCDDTEAGAKSSANSEGCHLQKAPRLAMERRDGRGGRAAVALLGCPKFLVRLRRLELLACAPRRRRCKEPVQPDSRERAPSRWQHRERAPDVPASIRTPFVSFLRMRAVRTTCAPVSPELLRAFCGGRKTQVLGFVHSGTSGVPVRARRMPHHALFDLRCVIDGQHVRSSGSHSLPHWRSNGSPSGCGPAKRRFPARRRADGCRAGCRLLLLLTYKDRLAHKTRITAN